MNKTAAIKAATALVALPQPTGVAYSITGRATLNDIHETTVTASNFRKAQRQRAAWIAALALEMLGVEDAPRKVVRFVFSRTTNPRVTTIVGALYK